MRRSANFAPLSQILVVPGCEVLRSETPQTPAESRAAYVGVFAALRTLRLYRYGIAFFEAVSDKGLNYNLNIEVGSCLVLGRRLALLTSGATSGLV